MVTDLTEKKQEEKTDGGEDDGYDRGGKVFCPTQESHKALSDTQLQWLCPE